MKRQGDGVGKKRGKRAARHVAVVQRQHLDAIVAGTKRVEVRLSRTRSAPFGAVARGDVVYLKEPGGAVRARAVVARVEQYAGLSPAGVRALARRYRGVCGPGSAGYWRSKSLARFGTLIWMERVEPDRMGRVPRLFGAGWLVLEPEAEAAGNDRAPFGRDQGQRLLKRPAVARWRAGRGVVR